MEKNIYSIKISADVREKDTIFIKDDRYVYYNVGAFLKYFVPENILPEGEGLELEDINFSEDFSISSEYHLTMPAEIKESDIGTISENTLFVDLAKVDIDSDEEYWVKALQKSPVSKAKKLEDFLKEKTSSESRIKEAPVDSNYLFSSRGWSAQKTCKTEDVRSFYQRSTLLFTTGKFSSRSIDKIPKTNCAKSASRNFFYKAIKK